MRVTRRARAILLAVALGLATTGCGGQLVEDEDVQSFAEAIEGEPASVAGGVDVVLGPSAFVVDDTLVVSAPRADVDEGSFVTVLGEYVVLSAEDLERLERDLAPGVDPELLGSFGVRLAVVADEVVAGEEAREEAGLSEATTD